MGDLVVAREGRVDRGPPLQHVGEDAVDDEVADEHAHRRAQQRIDATPVAARPDVAPTLPPRGDQLQDHLPEDEDERPHHVEAVREEGAVAGVGGALGLHPADGEDHVVGAAREEVAAARAAVREETLSGGVTALELGAILRRRAGDDHLPLLLDPAEGDDVLVRSEQEAGLRGAGLRGEIRLPLGEPVRAVLEPARHRRRMPVPHRPLQHRQRQAVDLEEDDPRRIGHDPLARAPRDALDHAQRVDVVVVGAEESRQDHADRRRRDGDGERRPEGVDRQARADPRRQEQHPCVEEQHAAEAEQRGERKPQSRDERRQEGVERGDEQRNGQRRAEGRVRRAGDEPRGDEQGDGSEQPRDHELSRPEARPLGRPARGLAVRCAH